MKKISLVIKETSGGYIKEGISKDDGSFFIVKYSGISSADMSILRQILRDSGASLLVVKNSVAKRVLKESGKEGLSSSIEGPCGFVFTSVDAAAVSKALCAFAKSHEPLKIEAGYLSGKAINAAEIQSLSKLPGKDVLLAQVVTAMKSPITGFVMVLNQTLLKFVYCIEQIKQKKSAG
jgi:large subunit ribosomal protein L10